MYLLLMIMKKLFLLLTLSIIVKPIMFNVSMGLMSS
ncbi:hypothetical protein RDI58_004354 [Solanum bulbocastanum]|uniref:Uncharacterized protein n=1 Tax=Solanum bulbocastanum TaxID=147425 RepID=A0AAN8TXK1_SOLBU